MLMGVGNCLRCNGLLQIEEDEWRCLLCGRYYYPQPPPLPENYVPEPKTHRKYNRMGYRDEIVTPHDINSVSKLIREYLLSLNLMERK